MQKKQSACSNLFPHVDCIQMNGFVLYLTRKLEFPWVVCAQCSCMPIWKFCVTKIMLMQNRPSDYVSYKVNKRKSFEFTSKNYVNEKGFFCACGRFQPRLNLN